MSKFKEWDVVYDPSADCLMIVIGFMEGNVMCKLSQTEWCPIIVISADSLVYIGQFWTDKERLMHEKQREIGWRVKEMEKLIFKLGQVGADIEMIRQQPLPQFDENGMIKIVPIEKVVKPKDSRYVLWNGKDDI